MGDQYGEGGRLLRDLRRMPAQDREIAIAALRWIAADPAPDGLAKRAAGFPRAPGVIEAIYDRFLILYMLDAGGVLFLRVIERVEL